MNSNHRTQSVILEEVIRESSKTELATSQTIPANKTSMTVQLSSGRSIEVAEQNKRDNLVVRNPDGEVELRVELTPEGPVLRFHAADLELASAGDIKVECNNYHVQARSSIVQQTRGDMHQMVSGDASLLVQGDLSTHAQETEIVSTRGDVRLRASDDVKLDGERVKLNC